MDYFNGKICAEPVEPEKYPQFAERPFPVVTRDVLGDKIQFTSVRVFTIDPATNRMCRLDRELDAYTKTFELGDVLWPLYTALQAENFGELIEKAAERGLYVFDIWGYLPGAIPRGDFTGGEYHIPPEASRLLFKKLGRRFLGFDNGEQDGRYVAGFAAWAASVVNDRKYQYRRFQAHFEKMGDHLKNRTAVLASLTYLHYFAREGNAVLLGAETGQALPNNNMWFSFIRGASKQYGILYFGNASVWNRWGYKCYESEGSAPGYVWGPDKGTSLSLLRRLMYAHYMYDCDILGFEQMHLMTENLEKRIKAAGDDLSPESLKLSPVGRIQQECVRLTERLGRPGTMYTPVAFVCDFFAGWTPPRHLYNSEVYKVWGNLPYETGDYQLHALFTLLYPGYENSGFYEDERGFMSPTPYGDIADVLLSDAPAEILDRYNVLVVTSGTRISPEFFDKLKKYVGRGGNIVIFGDAAARDLGGLEKFEEHPWHFVGLAEPAAVCGSGLNIVPHADAERLGTSAVRIKHGIGSVTLILSGHGTPGSGLDRTGDELTARNHPNGDIVNPYVFEPGARQLLHEIFTDLSLIDTGNLRLQHIVSVKSPCELTLFIANNGYASESYEISGKRVRVLSVEEIPVEDGAADQIHFLTTNHDTSGSKAQSPHTIGAGEFRLFSIKTEPGAFELKNAPEMKRKRPDLYLALSPDSGSPKEFCLNEPTFSHHFSGLVIPASYFDRIDTKFAKTEGGWLKRQNINVITDFTAMLNHYPDLSLVQNIPQRHTEVMKRIRAAIRKSALYGCRGIIVSPHRNAEAAWTREEALAGMLDSFAGISEIAANFGMTVYFRNARTFMRQADIYKEIAQKLGSPAFAFDAAAGLCAGFEAGDLPAAPKMLLLSSPHFDAFGQAYRFNQPVRGSQKQGELNKIYSEFMSAGGEITVLNADYESWDQVWADLKFLRINC